MQTLKLLTFTSVFFLSVTNVQAAPIEIKTPANLIGTWSLLTFDILDKEGNKTPWCEGLTGLLTYTKDGYMSAAINCKKTTEKSPARAYNDRLLYSGNYNVVEGPSVVHHVQNASADSIIGTDLVRKIAHLDKDNLTLTGDFGGNFLIVWKKAPIHAAVK